MKWSFPTLKAEVSAVEVATVVTAISLGLSVIYNLGFFWKAEASLTSLMTIQDFAIGATVAMLPLIGPIIPFLITPDMGLMGRIGPTRAETRNIESTPRHTVRRLMLRALDSIRRHRVIAYLVTSTAITLLMVAAFVSPAWIVSWWLSAYLVISAVCFFVLVGLTNFGRIEVAFAGLAWVFATAFLVGLGSYEVASARAPDDRIVLANGDVVSGNIVRISSSFVFMLIDGDLTVFSTSRVESVYTSSKPDAE